MLLPQQQSLLTELIQNTIVRVCVEHVPFEGRLELDGLVCINSDISGARQMVVKIHTVVGRKDIFADRLLAQATAWPLTAYVGIRNGLSQNVSQNVSQNLSQNAADAMRHDTRPSAHEDASPNVPEVLEDGDLRPCETADERLPAWSHHAPQILKLLTKSDAVPDKAAQPQPTDAVQSPPDGTEKPSEGAVKKEVVSSEDASSIEVNAADDNQGVKWRCKMCQHLCANFAELESHMRNMHVRFVCRLCLNNFTLSCNLRRHMKLHAGVRPHSCPYCSASFSRSTDLKIHMKKHPAAAAANDSESPQEPLSLKKSSVLHECDVCGKGFAAAAHLAEHRHTHAINAECQPQTEEKVLDLSDADQNTEEVDSMSENHLVTGSASEHEASIHSIATGSIDFAETVREFAPLFHLGDAAIDASEQGKASAFLATMAQNTNSLKTSAPSRSKRKGLPMKRIDIVVDDEELVADTDDGAPLVKDMKLSSAAPDTDESLTAWSQVSEEQPEVISGDLESKVFICQYAGGCLTMCHGFAAYERHYMAAHGGRFPCSLCPQSFTSRNNRRRHTDGHVGAAGHGRHQCLTCGKRFARADIIKEHRLTHTRSYQMGLCSKCGESCGTKKASLLIHLKRCLTAVEVDADIDDARVPEQDSMD